MLVKKLAYDVQRASSCETGTVVVYGFVEYRRSDLSRNVHVLMKTDNTIVFVRLEQLSS